MLKYPQYLGLHSGKFDKSPESVPMIFCKPLTNKKLFVEDKTAATHFIRHYTKNFVPPEDQMRFIETVETELMGLHKGNIARYRLRPAEFDQWQKTWR